MCFVNLLSCFSTISALLCFIVVIVTVAGPAEHYNDEDDYF